MYALAEYNKMSASMLQERYFPREPKMEAEAIRIEAYGLRELRLKQLEDKIEKAKENLKDLPMKQLRKARFLAEQGDERYREYWERQVEPLSCKT